MIGDISKREDELGGKTLLIAGIGRIGSRLAKAVLEKIDSSLGPRVGLAVAFLVGRPRHRGEGGPGNGTTRVEGTRHGSRNRPGRRPS